MALSHDQVTVRDYLLGHLNDQEQEKIEQRLMVEDELFEELEISKGELVEEYCAGELNKDDRQWFEHNYLASTEGRQRHALVLAISCLKHPQVVDRQPSFLEKITAFWARPRWVAGLASAALVLIIGFIGLRSLQQPKTSVSVALINTQVNRSNGNNTLPPKVNLPTDAGELRASLTLPKSFPQGTRFQAVLDNQVDRKQVNVVDHKENTVTVVVPARDLPAGEYALELTAIKTDGSEEAIPGIYRFDVN